MEDNRKYVLGLDVSTTTIGCAIFQDMGDHGKLDVITHVTPKLHKDFGNDLFLKAELFENDFIKKYKDVLLNNISTVVIEEPLLSSNNTNTAGTLLRFNGMISYLIYKNLGVKPVYVSSYDARKYAFPELMVLKTHNKKGEPYTEKEMSKMAPTLFGAFVEKITPEQFEVLPTLLQQYYLKEKGMYKLNKKLIIFELVDRKYDGIQWLYNKKDELMKECFDQSDAVTACLGYMQKTNQWK